MKQTIMLAITAVVLLGSLAATGESRCQAGETVPPSAGDRWELQIAYHEQVAHDKKDIQEGDYSKANYLTGQKSEAISSVMTVEHIAGILDYRITAILVPAPTQPLEKNLRYYIAEGVQAQIKDDFVHTSTGTTDLRNAKVEDMWKWEWHADRQAPIPLNIRLKTDASEKSYQLTLTPHGPMDLSDREPRPGFTIPWVYSTKHIVNGRVRFDCSGTMEVGSPENYPGSVFAGVPKELLAYDGSQKELRGEHTWTGKSSELDVVGAETPGCKKRKALVDSGRTFPAKSVTKTLTWTLRKLDQE
jgi:hypothetical protein